MLRRWYQALPGPPIVKALEAALIVIVVLLALGFAFEYLGRAILDDGGVIG
jgi:hypothetical protein